MRSAGVDSLDGQSGGRNLLVDRANEDTLNARRTAIGESATASSVHGSHDADGSAARLSTRGSVGRNGNSFRLSPRYSRREATAVVQRVDESSGFGSIHRKCQSAKRWFSDRLESFCADFFRGSAILHSRPTNGFRSAIFHCRLRFHDRISAEIRRLFFFLHSIRFLLCE